MAKLDVMANASPIYLRRNKDPSARMSSQAGSQRFCRPRLLAAAPWCRDQERGRGAGGNPYFSSSIILKGVSQQLECRLWSWKGSLEMGGLGLGAMSAAAPDC